MAGETITVQPLQHNRGFDWVFLVELLVCGVLALFFLFYFNRLFAALVSYGLRAYSWRKYRVYVDIQALQVSLLAGRIFFKGFRYHGKNETVLIHSGHITWRYWYRKVKEVECVRDKGSRKDATAATTSSAKQSADEREEGGLEASTHPLPCRLLLSIQGLEWFLYNRSAAYDAIIANILDGDDASPVPGEAASDPAYGDTSMGAKHRSSSTQQADMKDLAAGKSSPQISLLAHNENSASVEKKQSDAQSNGDKRHITQSLSSSEHEISAGQQGDPVEQGELSNFPLLKLLPVRIECNKGAVVMGNESVTCILTVKFDKASGEVDASSCRSPDHFRQLLNFRFNHPVMRMKPNLAYKGSTPPKTAGEKGTRPENGLADAQPILQAHRHDTTRRRGVFWSKLIRSRSEKVGMRHDNQHISADTSQEPLKSGAEKRWLGLSRYLEDDSDEHESWRSIEYARSSTIIESPKLSVSYYWDVAGVVPQVNEPSTSPSSRTSSINGDSAPGWGLHLVVEGGTVNYGPWADRCRSELQLIFFPRLFKDAVPAKILGPGEQRVSTAFTIFIELRDQLILRIPTREASKDGKWKVRAKDFESPQKSGRGYHKIKLNKDKKLASASAPHQIRPFGWLDIKIPSDSTISYTAHMAASLDGFHSSLGLDFNSTEVSTSVNHGLLWRSEAFKAKFDLPTPLRWNGLHTWDLQISAKSPELFLLREHVFLFSDLITDWTTGPPPDYYTFTPFKYITHIHLQKFKLYLNVNDANIINNPSDLDDNTFIVLQGSDLRSNLLVPVEKYRPDWNEIPFDIKVHDCQIKVHTPPWKTQSAFSGPSEVGTLPGGSLVGRYGYYTNTSPSLVDTVVLDLHGSGLSIDLFGFLVRYFIKIKDNYIGEDIHFKTLDEYQALQANKEVVTEETDESNKSHRITNGLDVIVNIEAVDVHINLPANLYATGDCVRLFLASLLVDLRVTNYYMDLEVSFSPVLMSLRAIVGDGTESQEEKPMTQVFVDGVNIHGHRLFGLPPTEPTYVCNWDFRVGKITGECSTEFLSKLTSGIQSFGFSFDDEENSLPPIPETIPDITFLRAVLQLLHVWVHVGQAAFLLSTDTVKFNFNDWATSQVSQRLDLSIKNFRVGCVTEGSVSDCEERTDASSNTVGLLETSLSLSILDRKTASTEAFLRQQKHIERHDLPTGRTRFLRRGQEQHDHSSLVIIEDQQPFITMPLPSMPSPLASFRTAPPETFGDRKGLIPASPSSTGRKNSSLSHPDTRNMWTPASDIRGSSSSTGEFNPMSVALRDDVHGAFSQRSLIMSAPRRTSNLGNTEDESSFPCFSSSFLAPYFPIGTIQPKMKDMPATPFDAEDANDYHLSQFPSFLKFSKAHNEACTHTAFIVRFTPGITAFGSPKAVESIVRLLRQMQATDPADILDKLQAQIFSKVSEFARQMHDISKTTELSLTLPTLQLRFIDMHAGTSSVQDPPAEDEYNLQLRRISIFARFTLKPDNGESLKRTYRLCVLHTRVDSTNASVGTKYGHASMLRTILGAYVEDISFQFCENKVLSILLQFRDFEITTESREIDHAARLIQHASASANQLSRDFSQLGKIESSFLQALVLSLTSMGENIPDPASLTRPSSVLRTAPDHIRLSDSWKIISRLRQIHQNLSTSAKGEIFTSVLKANIPIPVDAESRVLKTLDNWRSWELAHAKESYAMQKIYGPVQDSVSATPSDLPIRASLKTRSVKLLVDPGPDQNELGLDVLVVCVSIDIRAKNSDGKAFSLSDRSARTTVVEILSDQIIMRLNWDLCELVAGLFKTYQVSTDDVASHQSSAERCLSRPATDRDHYHFICVTNVGIVTFNTTNLKYMAACKAMQGSVLMQPELAGHEQDFNVSLHAAAASSELVSHSRVLINSSLLQPNLCISLQERPVNSESAKLVKIGGTCKELSCNIEEEISGLIQTICLVIDDEGASLSALLAQMPTPHKNEGPRNERPRKNLPIQLYAALFLDTYSLGVNLIPSLVYSITGSVARASVAPRLPSGYTFDFDLQKQMHQVLLPKDSNKNSLSTLNIPPVNGRIVFQNTTGNHLQLLISVDAIKVEAEAISNFLITISRPELMDVLREVERDWKALKRRIDIATSPHSEGSSATSASRKPLLYDCRLAVAGIRVHASAPGRSADHETYEMELDFGLTHIKATNCASYQGTMLNSPEVYLALQRVSAELMYCQRRLRQSCGSIIFAALFNSSATADTTGNMTGSYHAKFNTLRVDLTTKTASAFVNIAVSLQDTIKDIDFSKEVHYLRKMRKARPHSRSVLSSNDIKQENELATKIFSAMYSIQVSNVQIKWAVGAGYVAQSAEPVEDLFLTFKKIDLATRKESAAQLKIEDMQLQMAAADQRTSEHSCHSALLPEVIFNITYLPSSPSHRLAFQAVGKLLELRLTPRLILPASAVERSMTAAFADVKEALANWQRLPSSPEDTERITHHNNSPSSVFIDADFAGAVLYIQSGEKQDSESTIDSLSQGGRLPHHGRRGQSTSEEFSNTTTLRAPGVALKLEYKNDPRTSSSLNGEVKINSSTNVLYPRVVPLILEMSSSIKNVMSRSEENGQSIPPKSRDSRSRDEDAILQPGGIFGRCKLNMGLRICKQDFTLSCQPIARVTASTGFDEIYITVNTVTSSDYGQFLTLSAILTRMQATVKHVYSRESTGSFNVDSIFLSVMNSKHLSGTNGISAILRLSPTRASINTRQIQDFLLFRHIWIPADDDEDPKASDFTSARESQAYLVQRSHQVAAASALPWKVTGVIAELEVQLELGQALGKLSFNITNLWTSSQKSLDWDQNLCLGFRQIAIQGSGRLSGLVELQECKIRTSIQWPSREQPITETPLVQATIGFGQLQMKIAFDHQVFLIANMNSFFYFMYNVRERGVAKCDRLFASLEGEQVHVFCTATAAAQATALYQAFVRLVQEKQAAFEISLRDIDRFLQRKSHSEPRSRQPSAVATTDQTWLRRAVSLDTDVVVAIKELGTGVFPSTLFDNQVFKMEVLNARARFAVAMDQGRIHSRLELTLGQLRIAVSVVRRVQGPAKIAEVDIDGIIHRASSSRDGTILRVPKVVATMQTWQDPNSKLIDYIFRSSFEGKVDVGWNYSRIGFIRALWSSHSRALAQRLGKPVSQSAVKITGGPRPELPGAEAADLSRPPDDGGARTEKITAVVNVPQSKYEYRALEPAVIETPQLRDMGEATPPLEWIGLNRDRLPTLTHQIIIIALLGVAREVEEAYSKILGSS